MQLMEHNGKAASDWQLPPQSGQKFLQGCPQFEDRRWLCPPWVYISALFSQERVNDYSPKNVTFQDYVKNHALMCSERFVLAAFAVGFRL